MMRKSQPTLDTLRRRRATMLAYLRMKLDADDMHGVRDAAADIEVIDAEIRVVEAMAPTMTIESGTGGTELVDETRSYIQRVLGDELMKKRDADAKSIHALLAALAEKTADWEVLRKHGAGDDLIDKFRQAVEGTGR